MKDILNWTHLAGALIYTFMGLAVFVASFIAVDKATPYDLWLEIVQKQNRALATVVGAVSIGMCLIIAAAILG